jgi:hypothetical protein
MKFKPGRGVIKTSPRARDWIAGVVSGIEYKEVVADGQWDAWLVDKELQYGITFDTLNCTGFATLNAIEIQQFQQTGVQENYSDRFLAHIDGLTDFGNTITAPPDAIRKLGVCKESTWSWPRLDPNFTKVEYIFTPPPQTAYDEGVEWLKRWKLMYELLIDTQPATLIYHLKHVPLNVISSVCPGWGTDDVVQGCGIGNGHEYTIYGYDEGNFWKVLDHYDKDKKKLAWNYQFKAAIKNLLIPNETSMSPEAEAYLKSHDKKLVLAVPSGRNGYVKNMEIMEFNTSDRATLATLAVMRENGLGGGVTDALYDSCPKRPF